MKKTYLLFSILSFLLLSCTKVEFSEMSLNDVFTFAKKNNKKIFVVVGNTGCRKCDRYIKSINHDRDAKKVLNKEFICLKVNQDEANGKEFSQITGCAFYPYSCFFNARGEMLNLRIGDSDFDFNNIEKSEMDVYSYRELFNLPISFEQYKKRVSLSIQSLLIRNTEKGNIKKALLLSEQSIQIHPYAYNLFTATKLASSLNDTSLSNKYKKLFKENYTSYNEFLFSNLRLELGVFLDGYIAKKKNPNIDYKFSKKTLNFGRLEYKSKHKFKCEIINSGKEPLLIKLARASCSCTDLEWTKKPIMPNEKGFVKGVFHATKEGRFYKQIFVHLSSKVVPMSTVGIQGFVEKD